MKAKKKRLKAAHVPEHLTGRAREIWVEVVSQAPDGALYLADRSTVAVLASALALHEEATRKIAESGAVVGDGLSPWVKVLNEQASVISRTSRDLGTKYWRETRPGVVKAGKKEAAKAAAHEIGGRFATPAAPKLVVNN